MSFNEFLAETLKGFDTIELDSIIKRRMAIKPLYDCFQILLQEVAVHYLGQNRNSIKNLHLKSRWLLIKGCLPTEADSEKWDDTINELSNIRDKSEHNDYYDPDSGRLKEIRDRAPDFSTWILREGKIYFQKSSRFTFLEAFKDILSHNLITTDFILKRYGEDIPYAATIDFKLPREKYEYEFLSDLLNYLKEREGMIIKIEDIESKDLKMLFQLVKIISNFEGKVDSLIYKNICPKCGKNIIETHNVYGYEGSVVYYRMGCESCDYELESDYMSF